MNSLDADKDVKYNVDKKEINNKSKEDIYPLISIQPKPMKDDDIVLSPLQLTSKNSTDFKVSSMENLFELNGLINSYPHSDSERDSKLSVDEDNNNKLKSIRKQLIKNKKRINRILSNHGNMRENSSDDEEHVIHINFLDDGEEEEEEIDDYYLLREETEEPLNLDVQNLNPIISTMKSYI